MAFILHMKKLAITGLDNAALAEQQLRDLALALAHWLRQSRTTHVYYTRIGIGLKHVNEYLFDLPPNKNTPGCRLMLKGVYDAEQGALLVRLYNRNMLTAQAHYNKATTLDFLDSEALLAWYECLEEAE